jgi:hypothetical protein
MTKGYLGTTIEVLDSYKNAFYWQDGEHASDIYTGVRTLSEAVLQANALGFPDLPLPNAVSFRSTILADLWIETVDSNGRLKLYEKVTPTVKEILGLLLYKPNTITSYQFIAQAIWGDFDNREKIIGSHISSLKEHLGDPLRNNFRTIINRGVQYVPVDLRIKV